MDGRQREPRATRTGRLVRQWRLDRNPLRRASDRADTVVLTMLVLAFVVSAPLGALASGAWVHAAAQRAERAQAASRALVPAVVLTAPVTSETGGWGMASVTQVRWTAPDGKVVTTELPVPADTSAGMTLRLWTTRDGQLVPHPMTASQVTSLAELGEATGAAAAAVLLSVVGAMSHWSLSRRRLADWDADWRATGPRWTTRA
jgi:predicted small integral membrane protein